MKLEAINFRACLRPGLAWISALALSAGFLFGSSAANAAPPPANTRIGNQASASYTDPSGTSQLATSNAVETLILPVGSFTLDGLNQVTTTVVNKKSGAAGTILYTPHVIMNTGNGADTFNITIVDDNKQFSQIQVFADPDENGKPDSMPVLCTGSTTSCVVPAQSVAGNNGVFQFVVAYTIPASATSATTPYDTSTITVTPGTPALYTAPNTSAADKDQINLTTSAAFSANKVIGAPTTVLAPGNSPWPASPSSGPRSSSASCSTSWSTALASAPGCQYVVFTLDITNTGGAAGKFVITDTLPSGFTYVTGSAVWSSFSGTALGDGNAGDPPGINYQVTGNSLTAVIDSISTNNSQSISFVALVNPTAGATNTTNVAQYSSVDAPTATVTAPGLTPTVTNPAKYTVKAAYAIVLGANPSTAQTAADTTAGTVPNASSTDTTTKATAVPGSTIIYAQKAYNLGDATDTINLSLGSSTFPTGTLFAYVAADGVTPLLDSSGEGTPDTGPIEPGSSVNFAVRVTLPVNTTVGSGPYTAIVRGTSVGDTAKLESTRDTLTSVIGSLVDLTNSAGGTGVGSSGSGDLGPGPSPDPTTTVTVPAGTSAVFPLFVKNNDTTGPSNQSYTLQASQTNSFPGNLPANWTVKFVSAGATCSDAAISTVPVSSGQQQQVNACVTPPKEQGQVTAQRIYFHVVSNTPASTGAMVSDTKTDAVTVTLASTYSATLSPSNNGQASPGGSVTYAHTLTNTGTQACVGPYTVTANLSKDDEFAGWTAVIYLDNGDNILDVNGGDTLVTSPINGTLAVGAQQKYLVKVFAPGTEAGKNSTTTVTVTFPAGAASCGTHTVTDLTTVVTGQIRVKKTQASDLNCDGVADTTFASLPLSIAPGKCIIYQVIATNEGSSSVSNMTINDAAPAYTSLAGATQPATQCAGTKVSGTPLAYAVSGATVSCGSVANTVQPQGSGTLTFSVKINQ